MPKLEWDQVGARRYETGIDRGVLYLPDNVVVPWNGLTSMDETAPQENRSFYQDGVKILEHRILGDFVGKLRAITYPPEFEEPQGSRYLTEGVYLQDQRPVRFGLCYRSGVGNDINGTDHGFKLHLLYNLTAVPDTTVYKTMGAVVGVTEFGWTLTGIPEILRSFRPTCRMVIDSTKISEELLEHLEDLLYGTADSAPQLPSMQDVLDLITGRIVITDNGDGTWTATSFGFDEHITMTGPDEFQITEANASYLDSDTYVISTSEEP